MMKNYKNKDWLQIEYWDKKLSACEIAQIYGVAHTTILNWMKKFNISRRSYVDCTDYKIYDVNENVFHDINNPEKAYWLGFIMADGCVRARKKHRSYELIIKLKIGDKDHLKKFRDFLNSNIPVKECEIPSGFSKDKRAIISISRKKIVQDLKQYNIIPNKSKRLQFPNIPKKYYSDFIRGYFDGDGCLTISHRKKGNSQLKFGICSGTKSFLEKIQQILISELKLPKTKIMSSKITVHYLCYGGNQQVPRIFDYLLQNSDIKLERKYKALMEK